MTVELPLRCPLCGIMNDAVTEVHDEDVGPSNGDVTICSRCQFPALFVINDDGPSLRPFTDEEFIKAARESEEFRKILLLLIGPHAVMQVRDMNRRIKARSN